MDEKRGEAELVVGELVVGELLMDEERGRMDERGVDELLVDKNCLPQLLARKGRLLNVRAAECDTNGRLEVRNIELMIGRRLLSSLSSSLLSEISEIKLIRL